MRLKTRLVLATSVFTVLLTAALGSVFFSELLRGRLAEAAQENDFLTHELLLSMRGALVNGAAHEPSVANEAEFEQFVVDTLQRDTALRQTMDAFVAYTLTVQDVSVTGANGRVLVSTDPAQLAQQPPARRNFLVLDEGTLRQQMAIVFGRPEVLDVSLPLDRNGGPFLYAHIGVRSTLVRAVLLPWLREAAVVTALALLCSLGAAVLLSSLALRPIEKISRRLEALSRREAAAAESDKNESRQSGRDAEDRVSTTIAEIDRRIQVSEQHATNLSQMLQTLKDGVLLVNPDGTIAMLSDSVRHFLAGPVAVGSPIYDLFPGDAGVDAMVAEALRERRPLRGLMVPLNEERDVELSLNFGEGGGGAMLTLHDAAAREEIEQEIEVSRRMASIGRLTAGVGHEVKNPIHAMVLHLELLRSKLSETDGGGAARHVEVLAAEMTRLDRVVQVLADFTKPMEPVLREMPLRPVVESVLQLVSVDASLRGIDLGLEDTSRGAVAMIDREMLHQALLNVVLNAMDAMEGGGSLLVTMQRDRGAVEIGLRDNGPGMTPDVLEKIFHLYFTTKEGGSGIGLAMTWRMVQMMGGTISVQSTTGADSPERGTLFLVRFPLAVRSSPAPQSRLSEALEVQA